MTHAFIHSFMHLHPSLKQSIAMPACADADGHVCLDDIARHLVWVQAEGFCNISRQGCKISASGQQQRFLWRLQLVM